MIIAGLAIGSWLALWPTPANEDSSSKSVAMNTGRGQEKHSPSSLKAKSEPLAPQSPSSPEDSDSEGDVNKVPSSNLSDAVRALDPSDETAFDQLIQRLKSESGPNQGLEFGNALDENAGDALFRDKLILLADNLQSSENLGFWQKIASRNPPPAGGDPIELSAEPTPKRMRADLEIRMSLRNIRILSSSNPEARNVLKDFASREAEGYVAKSVKEIALTWLAEIDPREAARIRKVEALQKH